ncbi:hypothetical protein FACS189449_11920 [Alphaproteobacteria bacterium]|nr:hypothetical protein FACS189449_11920 [Alphaproteobacteria bacterium]
MKNKILSCMSAIVLAFSVVDTCSSTKVGNLAPPVDGIRTFVNPELSQRCAHGTL